jgi:hypothetical protein
MNPLLQIGAISFVATVIVVLAIYRTTYRVTETHLVIRVFGIPVRKIALRRIRRYVPDHGLFSELWVNRLMPGRRKLVLELRDGLLRHVVLSPRLPFVFRHELSEARRALKEAPIEDAAEPVNAPASVQQVN